MMMTPELEKIIEEKAEKHVTKYIGVFDELGIFHRNLWHERRIGYKKGFKAALTPEVLIHVPEVKALVEAVKMSERAFLCIRHNCPVNAFYAALDVSVPIVLEHIDVAQKMSGEALAEFEEFREGMG